MTTIEEALESYMNGNISYVKAWLGDNGNTTSGILSRTSSPPTIRPTKTSFTSSGGWHERPAICVGPPFNPRRYRHHVRTHNL